VVNDRWSTLSFNHKLMGMRPARALFDGLIKHAIAEDPAIVDHLSSPPVPHSDFTTPEYTQYEVTQAKKWEMTRGIGNSFGYNREETDADYASFREVLGPSFIDALAKNGNLLLNVGPSGGRGTIVDEQADRLSAFGTWLAQNGPAVYNTRPWVFAAANSDSPPTVRFTRKGETLYIIPIGVITGATLTIRGHHFTGVAHRVADGSAVALEPSRSDTVLKFTIPPGDAFSPAVAIVGGARNSL
jgi:alpha-L-fucosidase